MSGRCSVGGGPWLSDADRDANRKVIAELTERINSIYDSGVPFFTKDTIRDVSQQLQMSTAGLRMGDKAKLTFTVSGVDGISVEIPIEMGTSLGPYPDTPHLDIV